MRHQSLTPSGGPRNDSSPWEFIFSIFNIIRMIHTGREASKHIQKKDHA